MAVCSQDHSNQGRLNQENSRALASELALSRNTLGLAVLGHCLGMPGLCHHSKDRSDLGGFQSEEHRCSPARCTRVSLLLLQGRRAKSPQDEFYVLGAVSSLKGSARGLPVQSRGSMAHAHSQGGGCLPATTKGH